MKSKKNNKKNVIQVPVRAELRVWLEKHPTVTPLGGTFETTDYSLFVFDADNRDIRDKIIRNVTPGMEHFNEWDPCRPMVCYWDGTHLVIKDGQNRFAYAQDRGWPIRFSITPRDERPVSYQNLTPWRAEDHVEAGCKSGKPGYALVLQMMRVHGLSLSTITQLLAGEDDYPHQLMQLFKRGDELEFSEEEMKKAEERALFLEFVNEKRRYKLKLKNHKINSRLRGGLIRVYRQVQKGQVDREELFTAIEKRPKCVDNAVDWRELVRNIDTAFNAYRKKQGKSRVYIWEMVNEAEEEKAAERAKKYEENRRRKKIKLTTALSA